MQPDGPEPISLYGPGWEETALRSASFCPLQLASAVLAKQAGE